MYKLKLGVQYLAHVHTRNNLQHKHTAEVYGFKNNLI